MYNLYTQFRYMGESYWVFELVAIEVPLTWRNSELMKSNFGAVMEQTEWTISCSILLKKVLRAIMIVSSRFMRRGLQTSYLPHITTAQTLVANDITSTR